MRFEIIENVPPHPVEWRHRVITVTRLRSLANAVLLECGHTVIAFGKPGLYRRQTMLCAQCLDLWLARP